jgi:hypothetical protein
LFVEQHIEFSQRYAIRTKKGVNQLPAWLAMPPFNLR